jgi:flavin reductase (DIM6/NTAB) family NADH-FMN oxidoreductase RutF
MNHAPPSWFNRVSDAPPEVMFSSEQHTSISWLLVRVW